MPWYWSGHCQIKSSKGCVATVVAWSDAVDLVKKVWDRTLSILIYSIYLFICVYVCLFVGLFVIILLKLFNVNIFTQKKFDQACVVLFGMFVLSTKLLVSYI